MSDTGWVPASEDIKLLAEVGFLASAIGDVQKSCEIFEGVAGLKFEGSEVSCAIGPALAMLNVQDYGNAVKFLEDQLTHLSNSVELEVLPFYSLALRLSGQFTKSQKVLTEYHQILGSHEAITADLAQALERDRSGDSLSRLFS